MAEMIWAETDRLPGQKVEMTLARFAVYKRNGWRETTPPEPEEAEGEGSAEAQATSDEPTSEPAKPKAKKSSSGGSSSSKETSSGESTPPSE